MQTGSVYQRRGFPFGRGLAWRESAERAHIAVECKRQAVLACREAGLHLHVREGQERDVVYMCTADPAR